MRATFIAVALVAAVGAARPASAQLLTFDDIPSSGSAANSVFVPASYMGYTFGGTSTTAGCGFAGQCDWVTNRDIWTSSFPNSVSSPVSLWSNATSTLTLSRATAFNFTSASLGAAYGVCATGGTTAMTITSYLGAAQTNSTIRNLSCNTFVQETFNWTNVTRVEFSAPSLAANRTFDNILVANAAVVTPEPASLMLVGGGLVALGLAGRRRKSAASHR